MRGLLVCAVVAAVAAPVMAGISENIGVISIRTPGSTFVPGGGCDGIDANVIECVDLLEANPDGTFYVDIDVSCFTPGPDPQPVGMTAFQITLAGCDGLNLSAPVTMMTNVLNYAGTYAGWVGINPRAGDGFANRGWSMTDGLQWAAGPLPMGGPPANQVGCINMPAAPATNGWAAWAEVSTTGLSCPTCCCIGARQELTSDVGMGDANFDGLPRANITVIPLCIIPEPATALLLLAGLPLLRRRR